MIRTDGLPELQRALAVVDSGLHKNVVGGLREGGKIIERDAARRFAGPNPKIQGPTAKTAAGFRTYVRQGSVVSVEQSLRKTTGLHPGWGGLQMTEGLLPARDDNLDGVADSIDASVGDLLRGAGF